MAGLVAGDAGKGCWRGGTADTLMEEDELAEGCGWNGAAEFARYCSIAMGPASELERAVYPKSFRARPQPERLGGTKTISIDVRLHAATNRNPTQMMGDKLFRSDPYYRLRVFPITK